MPLQIQSLTSAVTPSLPEEFFIMFCSQYLSISPLSSNLLAYYFPLHLQWMTMQKYHREKKNRRPQAGTPSTFYLNTCKHLHDNHTFLWQNVRDVLLPSKAKISRVCLSSSVWVLIGILLHHTFILSPPASFLAPSHISISRCSDFPHLSTPPTQNSHCNFISFLLRPALAYSSLEFTAKFLEDVFMFVVPTALSPISCLSHS